MFDCVLTVCTGNICRSPLAEAYLRRRLPRVEWFSAGVAALVGEPAAGHALSVAQEADLALDAHRARQMDAACVTRGELILVMDKGQAAWIETRYPQARGRVFLLGHWSTDAEVPDPYGGTLAHFRSVYGQIQQCCEHWVDRLQ